MESGLAFLLQLLLVFAAIGQLLRVDCSLVEDFAKSTETSILGGMTASLIHRNDYFDSEWLTHREKMERDVRRSNLRAQSLARKRKLAGAIAASGVPAPDNEEWESPLSDVSAEYLMQISVGTSAKTFVAVADTGSDLTWLQCSPCMACFSGDCVGCINGVFDPNQSSTYTPLPCSSTTCKFLNETGPGASCPISAGGSVYGCTYDYTYGDGSFTLGNIAQDTITIASVTGSPAVLNNFTFGCSHNAGSNSSLLNSTDGLVGLGRGNISFPSQLGTYYGNVFGYCLVNRNFAATNRLYFGSDALPAGQQLQYTPMILSGSTFYFVNCTGIALGGNNIAAIPASAFDITTVNETSEGGLFFDSGTTFTALWEDIFNPLSNALQTEITNHGLSFSLGFFPLCYFADWSDWVNDYGKGVPIISFQFSNTSGFPLSVDSAWISIPIDEDYSVSPSVVCLAMQSMTQNVNIFGNTQQVDYHIVYDSGKGQIGFGQANCRSNSHKPVASIGTSLVAGLASLLLLLVLTQ